MKESLVRRKKSPADNAWEFDDPLGSDIVIARNGYVLTSDQLDEMISRIKMGNYLSVVAAAVGIPSEILVQWLQEGSNSKSSSDLRKMFLRVESAAAESEITAVGAWRKHFPKEWRSAPEFLSRRYPERWATKRENSEVKQSQNVNINLGSLSSDQIDELVRAIEESDHDRKSG